MNELQQFREELEKLVPPDSRLRPFVCGGSPLKSRIFIVGFNAATRLEKPFWEYWSDDSGFNKQKFMDDYLQHKKNGKLVGVRARIERIVKNAGPEITLETNLFAQPTPKASKDLGADKKVSKVFEFLMGSIRPEVVFLHSNEPIHFFRDRVKCSTFSKIERSPQDARWNRLQFQLLASSGPLFRKSFEAAEEIGCTLRAAYRAKRDNNE